MSNCAILSENFLDKISNHIKSYNYALDFSQLQSLTITKCDDLKLNPDSIGLIAFSSFEMEICNDIVFDKIDGCPIDSEPTSMVTFDIGTYFDWPISLNISQEEIMKYIILKLNKTLPNIDKIIISLENK